MTIPASAIVSVQPGVLPAGGTGVALTGMFLTNGTRVPIGTVQRFPSKPAVDAYFGPGSVESAWAGKYFSGFDNSTIKPGALSFTQYNQNAVAAYLRGGSVASIPISTLQTYSGSLTVIIDGYTHTASSINLSAVTSYSDAASTIASGLFASEPTEASFTASIATTVLTVSAVASGTLAVGQTVTGVGVAAGTIITSLGTGTGGIGTYNINNTQTVGSESMTASATAGTVTYDSVSGGFVVTSGITGAPSTIAFATGTIAADIKLTSATGAVLSQGAAAAVPGTFMDALVLLTTNWATFTTIFDPDNSGFANKLLFAEWEAAQNNRYAYVAWDTDVSPTTQSTATGSFGYALAQASIGGVELIWEDINNFQYLAAFQCGSIASIDFTELNGRATMDFKHQEGIVPNVTSALVASNLLSNGYNYYGAFASADTDFNFFNPGSITGEFLWADAYVNQIWLNTGLQTNLMTFLTNAKSVPYTRAGYDRIEAACKSMINAGLNFGAFSPGVQLSPSQIAEANATAGVDISQALFSQGYYFQVQPADAATRAARRSPPIKFWYCDAGSVQQINLASIAIQ